ncbi:NimA-related protein kinase 4 [Volvox carteri f. nagariensis]|uniref:non-specific serine/threonine protein kinase n=1 Tax=Volvox carteri f. nagariensis TaxID=3068 RepID=D8U3G1_VOLCA|nr:NimA-related protein kinase 4 [Volvox carteri f. nagariensis]EFJ45748.1 NimA-related protein kinase 4 [Volvox carteri f. nagariensis]|eukprot:XP_002953149.1 NimA-related protein kinase 4 [Volvox carteri f. nagariensis]
MARSTYDDFIIKEKIGSGSYGVVFKVIRKVDKHVYAMKEIDLQGMSRKEQEECIRETRVLSSLDSDYIIRYYDSFLEKGKLYIITEYAANGNLHDYIKKQKSWLKEELIWKLYIQILLGLNHMHSKKILHRDIKTLNVFLDEDVNVKLGDMGVAKILSTNTNFAKTIVGTPYYLSPELCEDKPYNEKSDVWALGVVLYECCTQRHPFDADNQGALILKILRGKFPPVTGYSPDISDLIKRCLTQNANRRPNTFKLLTLPSIRQKAEELGISLPDQATLALMADRNVAGGPGKARPKTPLGDGGVPEAAVASEPGDALASTIRTSEAVGTRPVDVTVTNVERTPGEGQPLGAAPAPVQAAWSVEDTKPKAQRPPAWGLAQQMENLDVEDEGDDEDDSKNPYLNPVQGDHEDGEEDEDVEGEEDEEYYENGDYVEGEGEEGDAGWAPDPTRIAHMRSAMMIQRAACLDLVGEKAFNELYALLKSNQVDEASMTDLSRLVFKIIPYDKSEVIQMMYKLLYLESQLEGH